MYLQILTPLHVAISLIGIVTGFIVMFGMFSGNPMDGMSKIFFWSTVLTSATGFLFPIHGVTPGIVIGVLSLIILAFAWMARYSHALAGGWRKTWIYTAILAQYLNFFVLIVQSFEKVPALHELAPTGKEPPFAIVQGVTLVVFIIMTVIAAKNFGKPARATQPA